MAELKTENLRTVALVGHGASGKTSLAEALLQAGLIRMRPIMMTTAAMVFGMLPMAIALNEGGGGRTDGPVSKGGKLLVQTVQVGEKAYQDFTLTTTNPGDNTPDPTSAA